MTNPWPGETAPPPQRIDNCPVVALLKRSTLPREIAHQWEVVIEFSPGLFEVVLVRWSVRRGYVASLRERPFTYEGGVQRMVERYGRAYH